MSKETKPIRYRILILIQIAILMGCSKANEQTFIVPRYSDLMVTGLKSEMVDENVKLRWNPGAYNDGYIVYRADYRQSSVPKDSDFEPIAQITDTFYVDEIGSTSNRFYYCVALYSPHCSCTGPMSGMVRSLNFEMDESGTQLIILSDSTNGSNSIVNSASEVPQAIKKLIHDEIEEKSDLVFLIDDTGSMSDDIDAIRKELFAITKNLPKGVRLGAATYNDNNTTNKWFRYTNLTTDYKKVEKFLNSIKAEGGGDLPESVYDGVIATIDTMKWENSVRHILIIGDAPPLEGKLTKHTRSEMISLCNDKGIVLNTIVIE